MLRAGAALVFSAIAIAQNAPDPEIVRAAKSPYDFSRYVDMHPKIDWKSMWNALGAKDTEMLGCGSFISRDDPCSTETITINNPDQVIVVLQPSGGGHLYTRFQKDPKGDWRLTGRFEAYIMNHPNRHEILRFGNKPFLKVGGLQGISGSGVDSEVERWFDLTLPSFEPVFSATLQGHLQRYGIGPSSRLNTYVTSAVVAGGEEIQVSAFVQYSVMEERDLGFAEYTGIYERTPGQRTFSFKSAKGQGGVMSQTDFELVASITDEGPSPEKLLVYALEGLKGVASGKDAEAKDWLRDVLARCKDTPEKRTLIELLAKP